MTDIVAGRRDTSVTLAIGQHRPSFTGRLGRQREWDPPIILSIWGEGANLCYCFLSSLKDSIENSLPSRAAQIYWLSYIRALYAWLSTSNSLTRTDRLRISIIGFLCKSVKQQSTTWLVPSKIQPTQTQCWFGIADLETCAGSSQTNVIICLQSDWICRRPGNQINP